MCTVWSKLMSLAASLGRMGLDFRSLVVDFLIKIVFERFSSAVRLATNTLVFPTVLLSSLNISTFLSRIRLQFFERSKSVVVGKRGTFFFVHGE